MPDSPFCRGSLGTRLDRSLIVKVSSLSDSILIACYINKKLAACNSVDDNRLNGVKADNSLYMDRPRPSDTNLGESLHVDSIRKK